MRLVTASTGKQALKLSKKDWLAIGKNRGWTTKAMTTEEAKEILGINEKDEKEEEKVPKKPLTKEEIEKAKKILLED